MKDSELVTFTNHDIGEIRGFIKDGEPWFLAGQVCRCLGIKNASQAVEAIDQKYKNAGVKGVCSTYTLLETAGGKQRITIIPEPFLYELIFNSRKSKAVRFRAWVACEVLPSLRKHGFYRMEGKLIRRSLTDAVQEKIIPAIESDIGKKFAYSNFSKLINKTLGLSDKVERGSLPDDVLEKIAHRENLVSALIEEGKDYHAIKEILEDLTK